MAATGRSTPIPAYYQGPTPRYQEAYPASHHMHAEGAPRARSEQGQSLDPYQQPQTPPHPYAADQWRVGDFPPPHPYRAAPREAPKDPPTPRHWPGAPRDEALSRKRRHSRFPLCTAHPPPARTLPTAPPRLNRSLAPLPLPKAPP